MNSTNPENQPTRPYSVPVDRQELLPFLLLLVDSAQDLDAAVEIRSSAFARHLPGQGKTLRTAEPDDGFSDVLLLIAERKIDRRVLGSIRLQPNLNRPLRIESVTTLPKPYHGQRLVEFMRLGVENGISGQMVMAALSKASFEICHAAAFDQIVAVGRRSTSEIYRAMRFDDVLQGATVDVPHAGNLPHSIYCLPLADADRRWKGSGHRLYDFMARTDHPDIRIDYEQVFQAFRTV